MPQWTTKSPQVASTEWPKFAQKNCIKMLKSCPFLPKIAQKLPSFGKVAQKLRATRLSRDHIQDSNSDRYTDLSLQNQPDKHYVIKIS